MESSTLWFGILPVLAFVILESLAGKRMAIAIALLLAFGEVVFSLAVYGTIDELTILAFVIVLIAGALSIKTDNDLYFKLQPAVVSTLFALIMLVYYFLLDRPLLNLMMHKYFPGGAASITGGKVPEEWFQKMLRILSRDLAFWFLLHAALVTWAALKLSKWWWLAMRVPMLYVLMFVAVFIAASSSVPG